MSSFSIPTLPLLNFYQPAGAGGSQSESDVLQMFLDLISAIPMPNTFYSQTNLDLDKLTYSQKKYIEFYNKFSERLNAYQAESEALQLSPVYLGRAERIRQIAEQILFCKKFQKDVEERAKQNQSLINQLKQTHPSVSIPNGSAPMDVTPSLIKRAMHGKRENPINQKAPPDRKRQKIDGTKMLIRTEKPDTFFSILEQAYPVGTKIRYHRENNKGQKAKIIRYNMGVKTITISLRQGEKLGKEIDVDPGDVFYIPEIETEVLMKHSKFPGPYYFVGKILKTSTSETGQTLILTAQIGASEKIQKVHSLTSLFPLTPSIRELIQSREVTNRFGKVELGYYFKDEQTK